LRKEDRIMAVADGQCMVMCSCPDNGSAAGLARTLVENRLAACVQIVPIQSVYAWKGEVCTEEERLLLIKTRAVLYSPIESYIIANHPYEVPEIVMIPLQEGLGSYLSWIDVMTGPQ
jgi:periplasmic divalent cation tolerance protein